MSAWWVILLLISATHAQRHQGATPMYEPYSQNLQQLAAFGDAQHRGPRWYDDTSGSSETSSSDLESARSSDPSSSSVSSHSRSDGSKSNSSEASSQETKEHRIRLRAYRVCTPCPQDMLKKHKNKGIKWICGAYQRARRSFKSGCMMRYRNCQDGTMFVKIHDLRCKNNTYHGRHWFYHYKV